MKTSEIKIIISLLLIGLLITGCEDLDLPEDTPRCIKQRIREFKRKEACDTGASVVEYDFQGQVVYVFGPGNCGADMIAKVVDKDCKEVCTLGGFSGNIVCNGDTLYLAATNEKVIWSN